MAVEYLVERFASQGGNGPRLRLRHGGDVRSGRQRSASERFVRIPSRQANSRTSGMRVGPCVSPLRASQAGPSPGGAPLHFLITRRTGARTRRWQLKRPRVQTRRVGIAHQIVRSAYVWWAVPTLHVLRVLRGGFFVDPVYVFLCASATLREPLTFLTSDYWSGAHSSLRKITEYCPLQNTIRPCFPEELQCGRRHNSEF
jgi:hypothetical protein